MWRRRAERERDYEMENRMEQRLQRVHTETLIRNRIHKPFDKVGNQSESSSLPTASPSSQTTVTGSTATSTATSLENQTFVGVKICCSGRCNCPFPSTSTGTYTKRHSTRDFASDDSGFLNDTTLLMSENSLASSLSGSLKTAKSSTSVTDTASVTDSEIREDWNERMLIYFIISVHTLK